MKLIYQLSTGVCYLFMQGVFSQKLDFCWLRVYRPWVCTEVVLAGGLSIVSVLALFFFRGGGTPNLAGIRFDLISVGLEYSVPGVHNGTSIPLQRRFAHHISVHVCADGGV